MAKIMEFYNEKQAERDLLHLKEVLGHIMSRKDIYEQMFEEAKKLDKERDERMMSVNPFLVQAIRQAEKKMFGAKTEDEFWAAAAEEAEYDMALEEADWEAFPLEEPEYTLESAFSPVDQEILCHMPVPDDLDYDHTKACPLELVKSELAKYKKAHPEKVIEAENAVREYERQDAEQEERNRRKRIPFPQKMEQ